MSKERSSLGVELIGSLNESNLVEVATEIGDVALDSFLQQGVLKEIPVLGWLVKFYGAQQSIRDRLFLKKIAAFYAGAGKASPKERVKFRKKIETNKEYQKKVGESLLLLIERHERFEKSLLLGRLFASFMSDDISHELFMRLSAALDKAVIEDLEALRGSESEYYTLHQRFEGLYRCGLMDLNLSLRPLNREAMQMGMRRGIEVERDVEIRYQINELGNLFIEHAMEVKSDL